MKDSTLDPIAGLFGRSLGPGDRCEELRAAEVLAVWTLAAGLPGGLGFLGCWGCGLGLGLPLLGKSGYAPGIFVYDYFRVRVVLWFSLRF